MVNPRNSGSTRWCVETTTVPGEERTDNCRLPPYRRVKDFQNLFPTSFQALASPASRRPHNRPLYWGRRYERRRSLDRGRCSRRPSPVHASSPTRDGSNSIVREASTCEVMAVVHFLVPRSQRAAAASSRSRETLPAEPQGSVPETSEAAETNALSARREENRLPDIPANGRRVAGAAESGSVTLSRSPMLPAELAACLAACAERHKGGKRVSPRTFL